MADNKRSGRDGSADELERYSRQILFEKIGEEGQRRLGAARVTLIGCGALGSVQAETLVRAGVGYLRIVDRDFLELNNLQRQVLFDEEDVASNLPKAEAARRKLARINSQVTIEAEVTDANYTNIERLADGADLLADGTDNFETRFLINDLAIKSDRPWVYGAVIGATGLCMAILPGETPCLRCVFEQAPPPEMNPTCDTAGVLGPVVQLVAGMQSMEAMKILSGRREEVSRQLLNIDAWSGRFTSLNVTAAREKSNCPCCVQRRFEYLDGKLASSGSTMCGRNAVQINPPAGMRIDFERMAKKLETVADGPVTSNRFLVRARVGELVVTVFADGRAIISGTDRVETARAAYSRYIGS